MRFLLGFHSILSVALGLAFWQIFDLKTAMSFLLGTALVLVNFAVLAVVWPVIFAKKQFALSIGVIVFKFAIFAWIMNEAVNASVRNQLFLGWFAGGIALVNVSALATAIRLHFSESRETP